MATENYSIAICKGAALLEETRNLIVDWNIGEPAEEFAERALSHGIVGSATAYRARDIIKRVFIPRFLKPSDKPARILKTVIEQGLSFSVFRELLLLFSARKDLLIYDFIIDGYWTAANRGKHSLDVEFVLSFISAAVAENKIEKPWSEQVSRKVSRGLLGLLTEVGFLRARQRGQREIIDYRISDLSLVLIARELHDAGFHNSALAQHPDWRLFGLKTNDVLNRLELLNEDYGLLLQRAGSVIAINWGVASIEELIGLISKNRKLSCRTY